MKTLRTLAILAAMASPLPAAIIVSGNIRTQGAPCTFEITTDIHVNITQNAAGTFVLFVFDDWVTSDGARTDLPLNPQLAFSLNGSNFSYPASLGDNLSVSLKSISSGDGFAYIVTPRTLVVGDVLTLKAGSYTFSGDTEFNRTTAKTFTGKLFVADNDGTMLSQLTSVPEPSAALLGLLGAGLMLRRRR